MLSFVSVSVSVSVSVLNADVAAVLLAAEDPVLRREKHMAKLAEMRRRELRAAARNEY